MNRNIVKTRLTSSKSSQIGLTPRSAVPPACRSTFKPKPATTICTAPSTVTSATMTSTQPIPSPTKCCFFRSAVRRYRRRPYPQGQSLLLLRLRRRTSAQYAIRHPTGFTGESFAFPTNCAPIATCSATIGRSIATTTSPFVVLAIPGPNLSTTSPAGRLPPAPQIPLAPATPCWPPGLGPSPPPSSTKRRPA